MTIRKVTSAEFSDFLKVQESRANAGATCRYYPKRDLTAWHVAGRLVAVSLGNLGDTRRAYFVEESRAVASQVHWLKLTSAPGHALEERAVFSAADLLKKDSTNC